MLIRSNSTNYQRNHAHLGRVSAVVGGVRVGSLGKAITESYSKNKKTTKLSPQQKQQNRLTERKYLFTLKDTSSKILTGERVGYCHNCRADFSRNTYIKSTETTSSGTKATWGNVFQCADVWVCPVCHKKIVYERGCEISRAVDAHVDKGKAVSMFTFTIPHSHDDKLDYLLKKLADARKRFFGDRVMRQVFELYRIIGHIDGLEVTHGRNGWHPHYHSEVFADYDMTAFYRDKLAVTKHYDKSGGLYYRYVDAKREQRLIKQGKDDLIEHITLAHFFKIQWGKFCRAVGLPNPSYRNGFTMQSGENAAKYISKFKTAQELTGSMTKQGRKGNRNQWEILHDASLGCERSKSLFKQYAECFHGKRQLIWSRGLKERFGIDDKHDDEVLGNDEFEQDEVVAQKFLDIEHSHWLVITRNRLQPHIEMMVSELGVEYTARYMNENFGKGRSIVVDSYDQLRRYDKFGNLVSGGCLVIAEKPKINPYPFGSPSHEFWENSQGV